MPTPDAFTSSGLNVESQSFVASTNATLDAMRAQIAAQGVAQQSLEARLENQGNDIVTNIQQTAQIRETPASTTNILQTLVARNP